MIRLSNQEGCLPYNSTILSMKFFLLIILLFIFGCSPKEGYSQKETRYYLKESLIKTFKLDIDAPKRFVNIEKHKDKVYFFYNMGWMGEDPLIEVRDFESGNIEEIITLPREGEQSFGVIADLFILSSDSIFLTGNSKPSIFLINGRGKLLRKYGLFDIYGNVKALPDSRFIGFSHQGRLYFNTTIPCLLHDFSCIDDMKNMSVLDIKTGDFKPSRFLGFPDEFEGRLLSLRAFGLAFNKKTEQTIISFSESHSLYKANMNDKDLDLQQINVPISKFTEKNFIGDVDMTVINEPYKMTHHIFNRNLYDHYGFHYDPYRDLYYRLVMLSIDMDYETVIDSLKVHPNEGYKIHNNRAVIIYDGNFNVVGEHKLPKDVYPFRSFVTEEGLWMEHYPENESEDSIYLKLLKPEVE